MKLALVLLCLSYASAQNLTGVTQVVQQAVNTIGGTLGVLGRTGYMEPSHSQENLDIDAYDTARIIAGFKYPVEVYTVCTDDGYLINIFRIPCKSSKHPKSVLLMADFYASSDYWVLSGPKYGLPYYLADLGYDVWLGNNRGGKYGQRHKILKKKDNAFWYYSFHEWGIYDLPAIVDFILEKVKCHKLSYIGWGYGAAEFFVMASEKPEYMGKIKNMQGVGPHVYLDHSRCRIKLASLNVDEESLYEIGGRSRLISSPLVLAMAGRDHCLKVAVKKEVCDYLEPVAHEGFNIDIPGYPEVACDPPIQGGMRFYLHILQTMRKKGFRLYDHGQAGNMLYYGRKCPPKYNIKAADVPIALYYSDDDNIATSKDVLHLSIEVPKLIRAFKIKEKNFGFVDFPLSKVGRSCYYNYVKEVLERYNDY